MSVYDLGGGTLRVTNQQAMSQYTVIRNGRIECDSSNGRAGLLLRHSITLEDLEVTHVGGNTNTEAPIYVLQTSNVTIRNVTVRQNGSGAAISIRESSNVTIEGCTVYMHDKSIDGGFVGIKVWGPLPANQKNTWKASGTTVKPNTPCTNVTITDCYIRYGYYGISSVGATGLTIKRCTCEDNMRGMSLQDTTEDFSVSGCDVRQNTSSGIHMAYGSKRGTVAGCMISSSLARGEGLVQCYVGCNTIKAEGNYFNNLSGATPKYVLYCGIDTSNVRFTGNRLFGDTARLDVGVEDIWDSTNRDPRHRLYNGSTADDGMNFGSCTNVAVLDNKDEAGVALRVGGYKPSNHPVTDTNFEAFS